MKWRVQLEAMHGYTVHVEADDDEAAEAIARRVIAMRLRSDTSGGTLYVSEVAPAAEDARLDVYACEHCGNSTGKEAWGPGRITCPICRKRTLTPAQRTDRSVKEMLNNPKLNRDSTTRGTLDIIIDELTRQPEGNVVLERSGLLTLLLYARRNWTDR